MYYMIFYLFFKMENVTDFYRTKNHTGVHTNDYK